MSMRPYLVAACLAIVIAINGYLLYKEEFMDQERKERHIMGRADPLVGIKYRKVKRGENLSAFGFPAKMADEAERRMRKLNDLYGAKLDSFLRTISDPNALADATCGKTNQLRPRYGAMRFLVEASGGRRDPIKLQGISGLEAQEWALRSPITEVYAHVELVDEPKPDATMMAVAAILEGKERDVLESIQPWGRSIMPGRWSWPKVKNAHRGIRQRLIEYFSLMHLVLERVNGPDGICSQEEDEEDKPG